MLTRIDLAAWAFLLIAIGMGYLICLKASKESAKLFKYGGYVIGILIVVVSLALMLYDLGSRVRRQKTLPRYDRKMPSIPIREPRVNIPEVPKLPRKAVGVTEQETTVPKTEK